MERMVEEIEMGSHLVVPGNFGLVRNRLVYLFVIFRRMRHVVIAMHRLLAVGIQFGLQNVAEHLNIVSSGTVALAHGGVEITLLVVELVGDSYLRQNLVVIIFRLSIQGTLQGKGGLLPHHVCRHRHEGRRLIMDAGVHQVVADAERSHQSGGEVEIALVIEAQVGLRRMVNARSTHAHRHADAARLLYRSRSRRIGRSLGHSLIHHLLHHRSMDGGIHLLLNGVAYLRGHRLVEEHGSIGLQPLTGEEAAHGPIPESAHGTIALEGDFLGEGVLKLLLQDVHVRGREIILIHEHAVFQILVAGDGREVEAPARIAQFEARDEIVSSIGAWEGRGRKICLSCFQIQLAIRKSILVYVLVIGKHIHLPARIESCLELQFAASLIVLVGAFARKGVSEKSLFSLVEAGKRKGEMIIELMIMGCLYVAIIFAAVAEFYLRALIIKGIVGIHFYQSALRILSVEGSLRTAEHIHPTQLVVVEIESRLAHHGNSIEIESDGRTVDTASDASYVN